jgi:hypothetical protein
LKGDFGMLSNEGKNNSQLLQEVAQQLWKNDLQMIKTKVEDAPFDMFVIQMMLYKRHEILLEYEKGTCAISVKVNGKYVYLDKLSNEKIIFGFNSMLPENVVNNFTILDNFLKNKAKE